MMPRTRLFVRSLLAVLLVAACVAAAIAPLLGPALAAPRYVPSAPATDIVISAFRFGTSADEGDEYIELFNRNCSTDVDLQNYTIKMSAGGGGSPVNLTLTFTGSSILAASHHFLLALQGSGYSADATYTTGSGTGISSSTGGVALFENGSPSIAVDQVGFSIDGYFEGTFLTANATNQTFVRKTGTGTNAGLYLDRNNNAIDFAVRNAYIPQDSTKTGTCGIPAVTATPTATKTPLGFNPPILINEVAWYGTTTNYQNDWIELYNTTAQAIDLTGWTLDALQSGVNIELNGTIKAHGYYLLVHDTTGSPGNATHTPTPAATPACHVFQTTDGVRIDQYFTGVLAYYNEVLFLTRPDGATVDTANRNSGYWPAGSYTNHASMERHATVPDSDIAWYTYAASSDPNAVHDCAGNRVYGTPGRRNWAAGVTATPSPVPTKYKTATPRPPTPFGHMVINEFLPRAGYDWNQDGTVDVFDEFVEVKNLGPVAAQLNGWKIDVISPGGPSSYSLSGITLQPDQRMLFYGLKSHLSLYDSGGTVRLINSRGIVVDARSYDAAGPRGYYPGQGLTEYEADGYDLHPKGAIEKCNFCSPRLKEGNLSACVATCPSGARTFGDIDDPNSDVSRLVTSGLPRARLEEQGTKPSVYFIDSDA